MARKKKDRRPTLADYAKLRAALETVAAGIQRHKAAGFRLRTWISGDRRMVRAVRDALKSPRPPSPEAVDYGAALEGFRLEDADLLLPDPAADFGEARETIEFQASGRLHSGAGPHAPELYQYLLQSAADGRNFIGVGAVDGIKLGTGAALLFGTEDNARTAIRHIAESEGLPASAYRLVEMVESGRVLEG